MASTLMPDASRLAGLSRNALIVGLLGLAASAAGAFIAREQFFRSYLMAFLFWGGLALGSFGVLLLHSVVGGRWGLTIRRPLEAGARTLPLVGLLFLPLIFGLRDLYIWARPEVVAADELLRHKASYLNGPFMIGRAIAFFLIWSLLAWRVTGLSMAQDVEGRTDTAQRLRKLAAPAIILHVLMITFASVDWLMSLDPHWFSTIFGALTLVGQVLEAFAFMVVITVWLGGPAVVEDRPVRGTIYDLGNLLLAFVMFWAYLAFSQFLIIWAGNLPEEIPWYLKRLTGGWQAVGLAIILFHFFLPFLMLINRGTKRNPRQLAGVAAIIALMRLVEIYFVVSPAGDMPSALKFHWLDLAAPIGLGGIWLAFFFRQLAGRAGVPARTLLAEVIEHGRA